MVDKKDAELMQKMASTMTLKLGAAGKLTDVKSAWLRHNQQSGLQVQVGYNTVKPSKALFLSICHASKKTGWATATDCCRAHAKATGASRDEMVTTSLDLVHTCGAQSVRRKRNYCARDIAEVSSIVDVHQPAASRAGNAKQCINMVKQATGVTVKTGQANCAIRSKSHHSIEAQVGQCMWPPSLFRAHEQDNPAGTHIHESLPCSWNTKLRQFGRCYVATSCAKTFWQHAGIGLTVCDGTHTKGSAFKHTLLLAVTFDGNNQVTILAWA